MMKKSCIFARVFHSAIKTMNAESGRKPIFIKQGLFEVIHNHAIFTDMNMQNKKKLLLVVLVLTFVSGYLNARTTDSLSTQTETISHNNLIKKVELWYDKNMNYGTITALMAVESSLIPFPSEVVIPPAAYVASKPGSHLNIYLVVVFGTIGALIGAYVNYFLALFLGRPVIYRLADSKLGKMMLLSGEKVEKAENYFNKHGKATTFFGRLIPVIRQLISLPAGLARMNFIVFSVYTFIGAGIWNIILALLGYLAHGQADLIDKYSNEISTIVKILVVVVALFFIVRYFVRKHKKKQTVSSKQDGGTE